MPKTSTAPIALLSFVLLCCGCITRESVYNDIHRSREASFRAWEAAHRGEQSTQNALQGELTVDAAALIAMGNNKQLKAILQQKEIAEGVITEAYSEALPTIDLSAGYTRLDKVGGFSTGGQSVSLGSKDNYSLRATLRQPIFRGGAVGAGIRAARLYRYLADEQVLGTVQSVLFDARTFYYDAVLADKLLSVSLSDLEIAQSHLQDVEKKRAQGVAADFDVLRARVEVSNVQAQLIQRQNALHLARTSLFKVMGVSQESRVDISTQLAYDPIQPDLAEAVQKAFAHRPDLLEAELSVRLQQEALRAARGSWWPELDLVFNDNLARPDPHDSTRDTWGEAWDAGISITYPLFDGFRRNGEIRRERATLEQKHIELLDAEEQALLEVKQAIFSIEDAGQLVKSQVDNLDRAREGLRLAQVGYREGVTTEVEVLDARQALSQTQALYYQAVHSHAIARLALERAMGLLKTPGEAPELTVE